MDQDCKIALHELDKRVVRVEQQQGQTIRDFEMMRLTGDNVHLSLHSAIEKLTSEFWAEMSSWREVFNGNGRPGIKAQVLQLENDVKALQDIEKDRKQVRLGMIIVLFGTILNIIITAINMFK